MQRPGPSFAEQCDATHPASLAFASAFLGCRGGALAHVLRASNEVPAAVISTGCPFGAMGQQHGEALLEPRAT